MLTEGWDYSVPLTELYTSLGLKIIIRSGHARVTHFLDVRAEVTKFCAWVSISVNISPIVALDPELLRLLCDILCSYSRSSRQKFHGWTLVKHQCWSNHKLPMLLAACNILHLQSIWGQSMKKGNELQSCWRLLLILYDWKPHSKSSMYWSPHCWITTRFSDYVRAMFPVLVGIVKVLYMGLLFAPNVKLSTCCSLCWRDTIFLVYSGHYYIHIIGQQSTGI